MHFKSGDRVRYTGAKEPDLYGRFAGHTGTVREQSSADNVYVSWDRAGINPGCGVYPENIEYIPAFSVGSRVTARNGEFAGEVIEIVPAAKVRWDNTGNENTWPLSELAREVKKPTIGELETTRREIAGEPKFKKGDVVQSIPAGWLATVDAFDAGIITVTSYFIKRHPFRYVDWFELITPAPEPSARHKPGSFVRITAENRTAIVNEDEGGSRRLPYLVTYTDEFDGGWYNAEDLEAWVPRQGERVECSDPEEAPGFGTVHAIKKEEPSDTMPSYYVEWDDKHGSYGPWGADELQPAGTRPAIQVYVLKAA